MSRASVWAPAAGAGAAHLVLVEIALYLMGDRRPEPAAMVGLVLLAAVPVALLCARRLRLPVALAGLGVVAVAVLEPVTPGPWVTVLGPDQLTVGMPVLRHYAEVSPLWLVVCLLAGLGEQTLRHRARDGWAHSGAVAAGLTAALLAAVLLTGVSRGWLVEPPMVLGWFLLSLAVFGFLAVLLLRRVHLVTPTAVLLVATAVAAVTSWVQSDGDAATAFVRMSGVPMILALLLGLVEAAVRGLVRLAHHPVGRSRPTVTRPPGPGRRRTARRAATTR